MSNYPDIKISKREVIYELISGAFGWGWLICLGFVIYNIILLIWYEGSWFSLIVWFVIGWVSKIIMIGIKNYKNELL